MFQILLALADEDRQRLANAGDVQALGALVRDVSVPVQSAV